MVRACGLVGALLCLMAAVGPAPSGPAVPVPRFVEVTDRSGVVFRHISGQEGVKNYIFEAKGGGVGALDYDNDGWMDLYVVQGSTLELHRSGKDPHGALFHNLGNWRFEEVTEKAGLTRAAWGMGVTAADFDNDGWVDLYLTNLGPNILYHNNGDGTFTDVTDKAGVGDPRWSTSASFGDYDADGLLDLFVPNYLDVGPDKLPVESTSCQYRGIPCMCGPRGLPGAPDSLYHNEGKGIFKDVTEESGVVDRDKFFGLGSIWADVNDDGLLDLYVANDATPNLLFVNKGGGRFVEMGFPSGLAVGGGGQEQASMGVDVADYDNDGRLDAYCTHFAADYSTLYRNEGNLLFQDVTGQAQIMVPEYPWVAWGTRFVDLNHDGWKDIFHANGHVYPFMRDRPNGKETYRQPHTLYLNLKSGTFLDASALAGPDIQKPSVGRGVAFADFDNDGDIDFVVANMNGSPQLFRTDVPGANHWAMFRTVGRKSNRDGIGTRITATAGGIRQVWEIKRTVGVYSCSDPRAHFGLGEAARIDKLQVRWPSGKSQELLDVAADRHYVIDEDGGLSEESFAAPGEAGRAAR
jgi:enediyne biosynthesis protein E4